MEDADNEEVEAELLYRKLETSVASFYGNPKVRARVRQHCIAMNGTFFNTHRMLGQYVANAYFPKASSIAATDQEVTNEETMREGVLV